MWTAEDGIGRGREGRSDMGGAQRPSMPRAQAGSEEPLHEPGSAAAGEPAPERGVSEAGRSDMEAAVQTAHSTLAELSDEDLMVQIVRGSEAAFAELVHRYEGRIVGLVGRFIGDRERALEITQEVFLRVFLHRKRYRRSGRFSTWIYTIAMNLAKNEIRRRSRLKGVTSLDHLMEAAGDAGGFVADKTPGPDRKAYQHEVEEIVMAAIEKLPPKYREVILLRDVQQLTYEEIEQVLNIPGGTVRSRINRARTALKKMLEPVLGRRPQQ